MPLVQVLCQSNGHRCQAITAEFSNSARFAPRSLYVVLYSHLLDYWQHLGGVCVRAQLSHLTGPSHLSPARPQYEWNCHQRRTSSQGDIGTFVRRRSHSISRCNAGSKQDHRVRSWRKRHPCHQQGTACIDVSHRLFLNFDCNCQVYIQEGAR